MSDDDAPSAGGVDRTSAGAGEDDGGQDARPRRAVAPGAPAGGSADARPREPCLRCGVPIDLRQMGCRGGHCPNCGHPYPHGDCSD